MKALLTRALGAATLIALGSCSHSGPGRGLAGGGKKEADPFAACKKLNKAELKAFRRFVKSDRGVGYSMAYLGELAHVFREDRENGKRKPLTMDAFIFEDKGIVFGHMDTYAKILLSSCAVVRNGEAPNVCLSKETQKRKDYEAYGATNDKATREYIASIEKKYGKNSQEAKDARAGTTYWDKQCGPYIPNAYRKAELLCGPLDAKIEDAKRTHPGMVREWVDTDKEIDENIYAWVFANSGIWDRDKNEHVSADEALKLCTDFKLVKKKNETQREYKNVEDAVEGLYRCLNAFRTARDDFHFETDPSTGRFKLDDKHVPIPKKNDLSRAYLGECLGSYADGTIETDEDGNPKPKAAPPPPANDPDQKKQDDKKHRYNGKDPDGQDVPPSDPKQPTDPNSKNIIKHAPDPSFTPDPDAKKGGFNQNKQEGVTGGDPNSKNHDKNAHARQKPCLPGDNPGKWECLSSDSCVRQFAQNIDYYRKKVPADLSTQMMLDMYKEERSNFIEELNKHQAELLRIGYVAAAFQRDFKTPKEYNANLKEFAPSCNRDSIKNKVAEKQKEEFMEEQYLDGAPDPLFGDQRNNVQTLGKQMIDATRQIVELREYIAMLNFDTGAKEVSTGKVPKFMPPELQILLTLAMPELAPLWIFFKYISGQDMSINFGNHGYYQCNMFSSGLGHDWVPRTKRLLTDADALIRKKFSNDWSRERAFCHKDEHGNLVRCEYPQIFQDYMQATDPKAFEMNKAYLERAEQWKVKFEEIKLKLRNTPSTIPQPEFDKLIADRNYTEKMVKYTSMTLDEIDERFRKIYTKGQELKNWMVLHGDWDRDDPKRKGFNEEVVMQQLSENDRAIVQEFNDLDEALGPFRIPLDDWCGMKRSAASELTSKTVQLTTLYPVLAHAFEDEYGKAEKPYIMEIAAALKKIDDNKELSNEQRKEKEDALASEISQKAQEVLPSKQGTLKNYLGKLCQDLNFPQTMDSTYEAILNGAFLNGFDYCDGNTDIKLGLNCRERRDFLSCKLASEAQGWLEDKRRPEFYRQVAMTVLDAAFMASAASGALKAAFTMRGLIIGGGIGLGMTEVNYRVSKWIAANNEGRWVDYNNAIGAMALEGVDSYTNALATIAAAAPERNLKEYVFGFVFGVATYGGAKTAAEALAKTKGPKVVTLADTMFELANKMIDVAEGRLPKAKFNEWLQAKVAEHPELLDEVQRNFADELSQMTDVEYAGRFRGTLGDIAMARTRKAMAVWLKAVSQRFVKVLDEMRADINLRKISSKKLALVEKFLSETEMGGVDFSLLAEKLGPREMATLANEMNEIMKAIEDEQFKLKPNAAARMKKAAEFIKKLCSIAASCSAFSGLKGCPL